MNRDDAQLGRLKDALTVQALRGARPCPSEDAIARDGRGFKDLHPLLQQRVLDQTAALYERDVDAVKLGDSRYPARLASLKGAPPVLFVWGAVDLLDAPGVGMCGSRHASDKGLQAARICGVEVAKRGLVIISGYAKGVDTETHLAALDSGGKTVIVLAEGILHFKKKRAFQKTGLDPHRVLVVSQFPPAQTWNAGAAMARNLVIAGLGRALVVVEAGETGGTLNAGLRALALGRPVLALHFASGTPPGNELLFGKGARRIRTTSQLGDAIGAIGEARDPTADQLSMLSTERDARAKTVPI
jgi:DNA processing protein